MYYFFFQRAAAAFLAIARLLAGVNAAARALPPLEAPSMARATAAGFRVSGSGAAPLVASWTIW